jgi:hypothetical protein
MRSFKARRRINGLGRPQGKRRQAAWQQKPADDRQGAAAAGAGASAEVEEMPLDVLLTAMRDEAHPIELRLAAAKAAAPYYHARISGGPPKASFEMTDIELQTAIAREKEHQLRADPGPHQIRVVSRR